MSTIRIVSGKTGRGVINKPLFATLETKRELEVPQTDDPSLSSFFDGLVRRVETLLDSTDCHRVTENGMNIACVVFPMDLSKDPRMMYLPLSLPNKNGDKPVLCRSREDKLLLVKAIHGDQKNLDSPTYASIASFNGKSVLCLVPERHTWEKQILSRLPIESVQVDDKGGQDQLFFHTKVFGGDGTYSKSQCEISRPMFRLWFQKCPGVCRDPLIEARFYPKLAKPTPEAPPARATCARAPPHTSKPNGVDLVADDRSVGRDGAEKNKKENTVSRKRHMYELMMGDEMLGQDAMNEIMGLISKVLQISMDDVYTGLVDNDARITGRIISMVGCAVTSDGRAATHADIISSFAHTLICQRANNEFKRVKAKIDEMFP